MGEITQAFKKTATKTAVGLLISFNLVTGLDTMHSVSQSNTAEIEAPVALRMFVALDRTKLGKAINHNPVGYCGETVVEIGGLFVGVPGMAIGGLLGWAGNKIDQFPPSRS